MPQPAWAKTVAQVAVRQGRSIADSLRQFREAGGHVRTQTYYRLYKQARLEGVFASKEFAASLRSIPVANEIQAATTPRARGFLQRVTVFGRDVEGNIMTREWSRRGDTLVSRERAIREALAFLQAGMEDPTAHDRYPFRALILGVYQGTYRFEPEAP